jgi:hypothetical protein
MSGIITATPNPALEPLRRGSQKIDQVNGQISDFMQAQASGEKPDSGAFTALLEQRMTVQQAMQAQLKLHEKPLKSVLSESR